MKRRRLNEKINKNILINVKRGCSEFGVSYPKYKKINTDKDKFMKYDENWRAKEKFIDDQLSKRNQSTHEHFQMKEEKTDENQQRSVYDNNRFNNVNNTVEKVKGNF